MSSTVTVGHLRHLTIPEIEREVTAARGEGRPVSDACAASIAAQWQSPGSALATLASGAKANKRDLIGDTQVEILVARRHKESVTILRALEAWVKAQ